MIVTDEAFDSGRRLSLLALYTLNGVKNSFKLVRASMKQNKLNKSQLQTTKKRSTKMKTL